MSDTDLQLLRRYARQHAEDAFAELVRRHLDLVFCAALRQVRSVQLAEDVAQSVFTDLSRNAERLPPNTILTAWLYQVTTRTAIDVVRREARRTLREQVAVELTSMNATAADWTAVEPLLDEAMNALDDGDRTAVLLRYFENKSLREVGEILSTTEEAARKRLSRAIERLREFLTKRGVTVGASGLAALIAANSVQAAPSGLAAAITAAALSGTAITTTAVIAATKAIAMTTLQKAIVTATVAVLAGAGIYEARQASISRSQLQAFQQGQAVPLNDTQKLTRERDDAASKLLMAHEENKRLARDTAELLKLRGEVGLLRRQVAEKSQPVSIQERNATVPSNPTTEAEFETQKRQITTALIRVGYALRQFMTNNPYGIIVDANGQPNSDIFAKLPGLPLDDLVIKVRDVQILARAMEQEPRLILAASKNPILFNGYWTRSYLLANGSISSFTGGREDLQFAVVYPPDEDLKTLMNQQTPEELKTLQSTMEPVMKAYSAANNGQMPNEPAQLTPYVTTPEEQAGLKQMLQWKRSSGSNSAPR